MIFKSFIVLCFLGFGFGSAFRYNGHGYDHYRGPPAPLNPDGTVSFTPEYEHIRDEHKEAFEREYQKIKNSVNAADPYSIPQSQKEHGNEDYGQYLPEIHDEETYDSSSTLEDDGKYNPELYEKPYSWLFDDGQYRPHIYEKEQQNEHQDISSSSSEIISFRPALVPAYSAIASSFLSYHHALSRHRRSTESYQGPLAPLNHDLTVDYTPEVKHVNAAHFSAIANQFNRLQSTAALAAAHPDLTSPPSKNYNPQNGGQNNPFEHQPHHQGLHFARRKRSYPGQYSPQQPNARHYDDGQYRPQQYNHDDGQYRPHSHYHYHGQYRPHLHQKVDYNIEPFRPAPLNADGTVAHLPEYHAIAASHLAAHHHALSFS